MYKTIIDKIKPDLEKSIAHFKEEMGALRTGRATPALIETVEVECYGGIRAGEKQLLNYQKEIVKEIGAEKAMAFDGGSSTSLYVDLPGKKLVLNSAKDRTARRVKSILVLK